MGRAYSDACTTDEASLKTVFSAYGEVVSAKVIYDNQTKKSKGCVFLFTGHAHTFSSACVFADVAQLACDQSVRKEVLSALPDV
eukprot:1195542-Prorocentrum_minimum.AAC.3